ncbi:hypothetical protein UMZ34_03595 [Halopseudomonas pachastrellae]|nr:hypothetical protein UMZ34_03595 [Halopseudomonas pachastrellae]
MCAPWLWDSQPALFEQLPAIARDGLVLDEAGAFNTRLEWLFADTRSSYRQGRDGEAGSPAGSNLWNIWSGCCCWAAGGACARCPFPGRRSAGALCSLGARAAAG